MKIAYITILVNLLIMMALVPSAYAQEGDPQASPQRDPALEQEIQDRLEAIAPDAVPIFQQATLAMDAGDLAAAKRGFEQVLELAPDFSDALRRLSQVEQREGNHEAAVALARRAYDLGHSPYDRMTLASALLGTESRADAQEALEHAQAVAAALPDDEQAHLILLYAGDVNQDKAAIRQASTRLVTLAPENPAGHYFVGLLAADDGEWERAERELLLAQELGVPAEYVQWALDNGIASEARWSRWRRRGLYAFGAWLVSMPVLFVVGAVLSKLTLATVHRPQFTTAFQVGRAERLVRLLYRLVILLTSLYFYISIPVLVLLVLAGTVGIFYLFLVAGRIPVKLAVLILLTALYTLYAVLRSVFTWRKDREPGRPLTREEAPQLWALTEEVAARVDARPVEAIYVMPSADIGVMEQGNFLQKLLGSGRRCLVLGLGALGGMTQGQFKAILAHEYGHFSNRDTAGGNLARQVQLSMHHMAYRLITSGQARWYNPAWLFVNGYYRIFLRITLGASRLQEILADRYAAMAYGVQNFVNGLRHIVRQNINFSLQVTREVQLASEMRRGLSNLYTLPAIELDGEEKLEQQVREVMNQPTSPYDSHPAVRERIALVERLEVEKGETSPQPVWDLLLNAEALQRDMTARVQGNLS